MPGAGCQPPPVRAAPPCWVCPWGLPPLRVPHVPAQNVAPNPFGVRGAVGFVFPCVAVRARRAAGGGEEQRSGWSCFFFFGFGLVSEVEELEMRPPRSLPALLRGSCLHPAPTQLLGGFSPPKQGSG